MRKILLISLCLSGFPCLQAQEDLVSTRYLQLQEAYTRRLQDIETGYKQAEREYLNQFILALPRMEQYYRNQGDLDGVVACKKLQETILQNMQYPDPDGEYPEEVQGEIEELIEKRDESFEQNQQELNKLNHMLYNALEPYKVAFTQEGNIESAMEVRELQMQLSESLELGDKPKASVQPTPVVSQNPNAYPFCLEPAKYATTPGVSPREPAIAFKPTIEGQARLNQSGVRFENGRVTIPSKAMGVLLAQVKRNQMLSVEFAIRAGGQHQWGHQAPALIFLYGESLQKANLAITQEGRNIYLYLRTTTPPENRPLYRVQLTRADASKPQHINLVYRSGELTVYIDGSETKKLRGNINGLLSNWEEYPVKMGLLPAPKGVENLPETINWRGQVYNFYIKSSLESARGVSQNYNRFSSAITR